MDDTYPSRGAAFAATEAGAADSQERLLGIVASATDAIIPAVVRDVSERLRSGEALRESEGRLRAIFDNAVEGIVTTDDLGVITSFNPAASRIFGYEPWEAVGHSVALLMPEP